MVKPKLIQTSRWKCHPERSDRVAWGLLAFQLLQQENDKYAKVFDVG